MIYLAEDEREIGGQLWKRLRVGCLPSVVRRLSVDSGSLDILVVFQSAASSLSS